MATKSGPAIDPIHQFSIHPVVSIQVAGHDVSLTNSGLFMLLAVALACLLVAIGARGGPGVPSRMQSMAEMAYEFVAGMVRSAAGEAGMRFFPFVFSIFFFVLLCNLIGFIPYSMAVTSQIVITAALALLVFCTVVIVGVREHGVALFQAVRPARRADLHSAAGRGDRDRLLSIAPGQSFGAPVRQHARRPHHALRLRQLRHHAARRRRRDQGAGRAAVRGDGRPRSPRTLGRRSCRPTCSPC